MKRSEMIALIIENSGLSKSKANKLLEVIEKNMMPPPYQLPDKSWHTQAEWEKE